MIEFVQEAACRALTQSNLGHVVTQDQADAAKFSDTVAWEADFNSGAYKGAQTFDMSPRGHFAFMLVQNNTVAAIAHHNHHHQLRAIAFFDISSRNWQEMIAEC